MSTRNIDIRQRSRTLLQGVCFALCSFGAVATASAQLTVSPQSDLTQLASSITGDGVQISNPVINCHTEGYGEFTYSGNALGIQQGILLTSGRRNEAIGPNDVENKSFQQGTPGSPILDVVTGRSTRDACLFEFDIIPSGDSLKFNFVFGSEEYNEWVGSQYNDVFGFFISGPGIVGNPGIGNDRNIALIPNTTQAVTINNVNNGSNSQYYFDNAGGQHIQYDGLTRGLKAISAVQPCQTYHLKLIVADASDRKFDSGVFIERIQSNNISMSLVTATGGPDLIEGCNSGVVRFTRGAVRPTPLTLEYYLQGTATNGTDYAAIGNIDPNVPKTVTIPANQASVDVPISPVADGIAEPTETLNFILGNPYCTGGILGSLVVNLADSLVSSVSPGTTTICPGGQVQFQVTGGANYSWSPAAGLSSTNTANPIASPSSTTNYSVVISQGTCSRTVNRLVRVSNPTLSGVVTRPLCAGNSNGALNLSVTGGTAPFSFAWTGPNGFSSTSEDLVNVIAGTYSVTATDGAGCTRTQSFNIGQPAPLSATLTPSILPFGENVACFGGATGTLSTSVSGGTAPFAFAWTGPNGFSSTAQNLTALRAGTYAVVVTDASGCTSNGSFTMNQPTPIGASVSNINHVSCFGSNIGSATVSNAGGTPPFSYSWNTTPVQTTATASGLAPGTWTATITDGYGCTSTANAVINGPSQALQNSVTSTTHVNCSGAATGAATINANGGTPPYSFSWNTSPVQTTATATGLSAGIWTCTVLDANGCTSTRNVTIEQPGSALSSAVAAQTNVLCFGNSTGSATVNASGGTAPYAYSWNTTPVRTTATANGLPAGVWTCTITDAVGCSVNRQVTITQPAAALSSSVAEQTNVLCFGNSTGSVRVNVNGGTAPYSYSWNTTPAQTGATASNLMAGSYNCTITDANGCTTVRAVTITQPPAVLASSVSAQTNVLCFGNSTGAATIAVTGGTPPFNYAWNTSPVQSTASATNLAAGSYSCTITDANGCTLVRNVTITQPSAALASSISAQTNVLCFGNSTGTATVNVNGGTAPYTYSWNTNPVQTSATATNLSAGTWMCSITDANGCSNTRSVNIAQPLAALAASVASQTNVNCFGGNTGSALLSVSGGTAPYTYSWNTTPVQTTPNATNLAAGTYTCIITDANGCSMGRSVMISQPAAALAATISDQLNVLCFGNNTGSATIVASGGSTPYTFNWNTTPAQSTATASNLSAGTWTCTVTDNNGCTATRNVVIAQPAAALASGLSAQSNVLCHGSNTGIATVSATGGTTPYSYSWNTTPVQTTATASALPAGSWTCTITDGNGCTSSTSATIAQPAAALSANVSAQSNVSCHGSNTGSATIQVTGGTAPYTYSWNTAPVQTTATAINLFAGTRTCTITDANGCSTTRNVTITQPAAAISITGTITSATCGGALDGAVDANVSGGTTPYNIAWTGPNGFTSNNIDISAVGSGAYLLTVTDGNGCTSSNSFNVGQPGLFTINATLSDHNGYAVSCPGSADGSIDQSVSGGTSPYTHSWIGPNGFTASSDDIAGLSSGTYTYVVTDQNGCSTSATYQMDAPEAASAAFSSPTVIGGWNIACAAQNSGAIGTTITGGAVAVSVVWSGPGGFSSTDEDLSDLFEGVYTLTMTDQNGCITSDAITLTAPMALTGAGTMISGVDCAGANNGIAQTTVSGGTAPFNYSWNTSPVQTSSNATDLPIGNWTCTITDANGCSTNANTLITGPATPLSVAITAQSDVLCSGANEGTASALASGGTTPHSYSWNSAPAQSGSSASALAVGDYTVTVTDANGCSATDDVNISGPTGPIEVFIDEITPVTCAGANDGAATVTISGGSGAYTVTWDTEPVTNGPTASGLAPGNYTVSVNDNNGCSETKSHPVTILGASSQLELAMDITNISCNGAADGSVDLTLSGGQGPYTHTWSDSGGLSTGIEDLVDLDPDVYTLVVIDGFGCRIDTTVTMTAPPALALSGTITPAACLGTPTGAVDATINGGTAPYSRTWSGPDGFTANTEDVTSLQSGIYTLLVTDDNGCTASESFNVDQPGSLDVTVTATLYDGANGVSCAGANDGAIDMEVNGGTAPYTINWSGPNGFISSDEDLSDLTSGTYSVSVQDDNGCAVQQQLTLATPDVLAIDPVVTSYLGGFHVSCYGAADGEVDLSITGGTAPFDIQWSDGIGFNATSEDISGVGPGSYSVSVTDANGCVQNATVMLNAPDALDLAADLSVINGNNVSCEGASDGSINLTVIGGVGPFQYNWSNGGVSEDLDEIGAGTYSVIVTDMNGCTASASYLLTAPVTVSVTLTASTYANGMNISCGGANDASISAAIAGGSSPYDLIWSGPNGFSSTAPTITDLPLGEYTLNITDLNGCQHTSAVMLVGPAPLSLDLTTTTYTGGFNIPCSEVTIGVLDAHVSGGLPGFSFDWTGPDGFTSTASNLAALAAGTYDLTVTDNFGCTASASTSLTAPDPLAVVIELSDFNGSPVSCAGNDGGMELTVTGGTPDYAFDWTGPNGFASQEEDIADLSAGTYTLIVHDANGCSADTTVSLSAPLPLSVEFNILANACASDASGTVEATISGGGAPYALAWSGPMGFTSTDEDLSAIVNGTYTLDVSDALGCTASFTAQLDGPQAITTGTYVSFYGLFNLQCQGDSTGVIELEPLGGVAPFSVLLNGPNGFSSTSIENTGLAAGSYDLTLTDANGCVVDSTIVLSEPDNGVNAELTLSVYPSGTNVSCFGASDGSIDATVTGGTGPYVFSWRGPDSLEFVTEDVTNLPAGDYAYELVVTDANQCSFFTTVTLTQPDSALMMESVLSVFQGGTNTSCHGSSDGAIDLSAAGGNGSYTYAWSGPNGFTSTAQDITDLVGGTYDITIVDLNGCVLDSAIQVLAPAILDPTLEAFTYPGGSTISCNGLTDGSLSAVVTGGTAPHAVLWSGPDGFSASTMSIEQLAAGTYCAIVSDANGCNAEACMTLEAPAQLEASTVTTIAACGTNNGSVDLSVSGGSAPFTFDWDNGAGSEDLGGLAPGTFNVSITDANGCTVNATAVVDGSPSIVVQATLNNTACFGSGEGDIDLQLQNGTAPYSFQWSNGSSSEDLIDVAAGTYSVSVTDAAGCAFNATYTLLQATEIFIDTLISTYTGGHNISSFGAQDGSITTVVSGGVEPYVFAWSNGSNTESLTGLGAGTYSLLVTDANGCTARIEVTLTENNDLEMPTAFSPNSDGSNDSFVIRGIEGYPKNLFTVINRWGNVVYEQPNYKNQWRGDNSQGALPDGTYFIILSLNDGTRTLQGYVDLRR